MMAGARAGRAREAASLRGVGTAVATLAAAAAGAFVGDSLGAQLASPAPEPAPPVLDAGVARLPVPDGWWPGAPRFTLAGAPEAAGMWSGSTDAVFAVLPPEDASLVPAALVEHAGQAPSRRPVPADVRGWRYELTLSGYPGRTTLLVMPASTGVVTLACVPSVGAAPGTADECVDAARQVELRRGAWIQPGPDSAVRIALPGAIARLDERRRAGRRALAAASTGPARARAARSVARAYAGAHDALRPLAAPGRSAALARALGGLATDHRGLAIAHENRYPRLATRSGARIARQEERLQRLIAALAPPDGA
jgi:hypothetical protein